MDEFEQLWAMQPAAFTAFMQADTAGKTVPEARSRSGLFDDEPHESPYELADGVAVIPVEGVISRRGDWGGASLRGVRTALGDRKSVV